MFGELILDIFHGSPWPDGEWTLPAVCVVDVLDKDFEIDGRCVAGEAIVMTHDIILDDRQYDVCKDRKMQSGDGAECCDAQRPNGRES